MLVLALRNRVGFDHHKTRKWFFSFVQLLLRHEMFIEAGTVLQLSEDEEIKQLNKKSTTIPLTCGHCGKKSERTGAMCDSCRRALATCALCQTAVHGLFAWCQGCGHGGHLYCMRQWFQENSLCPTGCLHRCVFTTGTHSDTIVAGDLR
mmetsp:Transcript_25559/g.50335  ORF Transcript_25559/g.50335 Transcript_25559/m.50335 type:complete len:149 (-) Transcript_25559:20-466(-)